MPGKWFIRLLLSYLPIFILVIFSLSIIFFAIVNNVSREQAQRANEVFMEQVLVQLDRTLEFNSQQIMKETSYNDELKGYYFKSSQEVFESLVVPSKKLRETIGSLPLVDSIYMYRTADEMVLSKNVIMPLSEFGDQEFARKILREGAPPKWFPVRPYREFADEPPTNVITLVRNVPLLSGDRGFIVVNVGVQVLAKYILDMSSSKFSYIQLEDQNGTAILNANAPQNGSEINSAVSAYTGWIIHSGLRDGGLFHVFSRIHWIWLGITAGTLIMGFVWFILATKRNYRPVEVIVEQIRHFAKQKSQLLIANGGNDEFRFIETALNRLVEQSNKYEQQHQDDLLYRRQYFFQETIKGTRAISPEEWIGELNGLESTHELKCLIVAVIEIDKYQEFISAYHQRDQSLLKFVVKSVVNEIAGKHAIPVWSEWIANERLGVLYGTASDEEASLRILKNMGEELRLWVENHLHFSVTSGIGSGVVEVTEIPLSFEDARNALKYKTVLGGAGTFLYSEMNAKSSDTIYRNLDIIRKLTSCFKQNNEEWELIFEEMFLNLHNNLSSKEEIIIAVNYLNYHLNQSLEEMAYEYRRNWDLEIYPKLSGIVGKFETLDEVKVQYHDLLGETFDHIRRMREKRSGHTLILDIKSYIEEQYADPNLSLQMISDHFQLNTKYISQLFKDEMGEKFVDYLALLRIRHARQLLEETNAAIQDIAMKVGYTHSLSFIRLFKKVMNVTPGDYRKQKAM
ncbi:helix-turn-helix domain-containing protein [Paenibacillus sp. LMG 31461]|uniref:Helix-turn-helix domain-containing protein n=1 Tax=Paenibacillus plantarum TaxID=2654975 RepID=A0ABX1XCB7_9BACL|nr:helix-turn-helix domain-containing protein [Paenibacillus plantarum]NOU66120.1 helix-turn-helix domain-containing protein [Paenibacillus plantarum]